MIEHEFFDNGEKITESEWIARYGEVPQPEPDPEISADEALEILMGGAV